MKPVIKSDFDEAVIYTKILDDRTLLVVDAVTTIRYLDIETLKVKSGFRANIKHSGYSSNVVDFSSDAQNFATISSDSKEARLYDTNTKKTVATISRHQGEVSCVGIDPKNRYMFSCGDDGATFAVDMSSGHLAFTLPRHIDSINEIVFSNNGQLIATASYDKNISIFSLNTMRQKHKLRAHSAPVVKLHFLSENRLFSVDKNSSAIIWNIKSGKIITRLIGIHDDITQVAIGNDGLFLFLGTKLGYVLVYNMKNYELITRKYIKLHHAITSLNFDEQKKNLVLATESGSLCIYNIFENELYLNELLQEKKYDAIQECIDKNPLLEYTKASQIVNALWERTVQKAKEFLGNSDKTKAIKLFENFITIPSKKQIMQKLIQEYSEFDKFIISINQGKLALAYSLVNTHPVYKESSAYIAMEIKWKKLFEQAQKYLLDPKTSDKAIEILAPYRGVTEKTLLIQNMMANAQIHRRFKVAIGQKDFKLTFEILKQNPFLKEYSDYETLMKYSDALYVKSQIFINEGDTHSAIKILRILLDFEDFKDEAKDTIFEIENRHKFFNAIEDNDMIVAYNMLDVSDYLQESEEGKKLQKLWENDLNIANKYATSGDIDGIKKVLEKYMRISSKNMAIATVVSWCYITQLEESIKKKQDQRAIENGIKNYILYFGLTEQILSFFEMFQVSYPSTKLNLQSQTEGSINRWRPPMIVESILS